MSPALSFFLGFLSGLAYNEHIYRSSRRFPHSRVFTSFLLRFSLLALIILLIARLYGSKALLFFIVGNLVGRGLHTLIRGFVVVRY